MKPGMPTGLFAVTCLLAACSHPSSAPGASTATNPASPVGQTEAQATAPLASDVPAESPRQVEPPPGARMAPTSSVTSAGTERIYESRVPYPDAVDFIDRTLPEEGCETIRRSQTKTSTVWVARCSSGDQVHVSVRQTDPTTVDVLEPTAAPALRP